MAEIKKFSDFKIEKQSGSKLVGERIKIHKLFGKEIVIYWYSMEETKVEAFKRAGNVDCLYLQISLCGVSHVLFTQSIGLIKMIKEVPKDGFPFSATIIEDEYNRYSFN